MPKDVTMLQSAFKRYYFENFNLMHIDDMKHHEFGYQRFDDTMYRHVVFSSVEEFRLFLMNKIPSDVYCSSAYYDFPGLAMKDKGFRGADLIFDIDAKDLKLSCRDKHVIYTCVTCGSLKNMCRCDVSKVQVQSLACDRCIDAARNEAVKLVSILSDDFGIPDVSVYFSGNEGFHVHAGNTYASLDSRQRQEICDYVSSRGVKIDSQVTTDVSRIFRLAGTLNSKSGLAKMHCDNLDEFVPYTESCVIDDDTVDICADCPVSFSLKGEQFGPWYNETVSLPRFAAVYLVCKRFGKM